MNAAFETLIQQAEQVLAADELAWVSRAVYRGANVHHGRTVIAARVRFGRWRGHRIGDLPPAFIAECLSRLVRGAKAPPNAPQAQVLEALLCNDEPITLERLLLECVLVLERRLAVERLDLIPIDKAEVRDAGGDGEVDLVWSTQDPPRSAAVSQLMVGEFNRLLALAQGCPAPSTALLDAEHATLLDRAQRKVTPGTTSALLLAAHQRGVYTDALGGPQVHFGQGNLHRLAHSTVLDGESMASTRLARHKARTTRRLVELGLPTPQQILVHSAGDAVTAAQRIGFPVVVKPLRGSGGEGVSVGLTDAEGVALAARRASDAAGPIVVEAMVSGTTFRLLVIGGKFCCALRLDPPRVMGDGRHTVRQLVAQANADPMRDGIRLERIALDEPFIARQGYTLDAVPPARQAVMVCGAANIASGATHTDVTDEVHGAHVELAERAAAALELLTAGVDLVSRNIALPPVAANTHILEVNARPGLIEHMFPFRGTPRPAADRVLDLMFPPPAAGRIPTALVLGRRGGSATAEAIAAQLHQQKVAVGVATRQRCFITGTGFDDPDITMHDGVGRMWSDPHVGALVVAIDTRRALTNGLVVEAADVLCLLPHDDAEPTDDVVEAVQLAAPVCRAVVARHGDEVVATALESAVQRGDIAPGDIHWLPDGADRAEFTAATAAYLSGLLPPPASPRLP